MKTHLTSFIWPKRGLSAVSAAGLFPMIVPHCNQFYLDETTAVHLHDYAGEMWIGLKRFRLQPGDITLSPSRWRTRYALDAGGTHLCIHFSPSEAVSRSDAVPLPLHSRLGPQTAAARERFWRIIDHFRQSGNKADSIAACAASASLQEFLLWLHLQSRRGVTPRRSSLVEEALMKLGQAIDASLSKRLLIGELAANVGLSAEYVARLFARRYGMTLQHYLLLRRVELARHLLVSSDLLVSEIGRRVGMPDPQYFNKQFRRVVGQSPFVYRGVQTRQSLAGEKRKSK